MTVSFKIVEHSYRPGEKLVEIWLEGKVIGVIYPEEKNKIKIVSAHFSEEDIPKDFDGEVVEEKEVGSIPAIHITFEPRKYIIIGGRIVYLE